MDTFYELLRNHFVQGLLLGLLLAGFIWKNSFTAKRNLRRENLRLEGDLKNLQNHLNTQLKITASGNESLQTELEELRKQNETLRINNAALQQKPGRGELRQLHIQEIAIRTMREQAPGFAAAWEKALRHGEAEVDAAESGFTKLVRKVIPGLGNTTAQPTQAITVTEETTERP